MRSLPFAVVAASAVTLAVLAGCAESSPPPTPTATAAAAFTVSLRALASGFDRPVFLASALGHTFLAQQGGQVLDLGPGNWSASERRPVVLDITHEVSSGGEQGLLGMAFDPAQPGHMYVDFTDSAGDTQVDAYRLTCDLAGCAASRLGNVLSVHQPYSNHNGGMLAFGPDGQLYIGLGDGGSGGDPQGNGQRLDTMLGKILRITPSPKQCFTTPCPQYDEPEGNPFRQQEGRSGAIWHYGLRNPWRFSFDRGAPDGAGRGDLWIGDVGQNLREEVDRAPAGQGGLNFGWNHFEGNRVYEDATRADQAVAPVLDYDHSHGRCSVTGGYVVRDGATALDGWYVYADYCSGELWGLDTRHIGQGPRLLLDSELHVSSFAEDAQGHAVVIDLEGSIHALVA